MDIGRYYDELNSDVSDVGSVVKSGRRMPYSQQGINDKMFRPATGEDIGFGAIPEKRPTGGGVWGGGAPAIKPIVNTEEGGGYRPVQPGGGYSPNPGLSKDPLGVYPGEPSGVNPTTKPGRPAIGTRIEDMRKPKGITRRPEPMRNLEGMFGNMKTYGGMDAVPN